MESQPQNPESRNNKKNPENFHPCINVQPICDKTDNWTLHSVKTQISPGIYPD